MDWDLLQTAVERLCKQQLLRLLRAHEQHFQPQAISTAPEGLTLLLKGTSGDIYVLRGRGATLTCSCPDAATSLATHCKHACWVLTVMGGGGVSALQGDPSSVVSALETARARVEALLRAESDKYAAVAEKCGPDEDCPICYDPLGPAEGCRSCPVCRKHFHTRCIFRALRSTTLCPMCRSGSWNDIVWSVVHS